MRPIDADAFKKYIDAQEGRPFIGCTVGEAMKILIDEQPTIQPENAQLSKEDTTSDMISRQQALNALIYAVKNVGILDADDIRTVFKALPTIQPEPKWIPVSERMPRDGSWNIFTDGKNISVERYKADAIDHFFPNGRWFQLEDVIAWMPLPEAYKPNK